MPKWPLNYLMGDPHQPQPRIIKIQNHNRANIKPQIDPIRTRHTRATRYRASYNRSNNSYKQDIVPTCRSPRYPLQYQKSVVKQVTRHNFVSHNPQSTLILPAQGEYFHQHYYVTPRHPSCIGTEFTWRRAGISCFSNQTVTHAKFNDVRISH